jgi:hypothetical protein
VSDAVRVSVDLAMMIGVGVWAYVMVPLLTLAHELGHARVAIRCGRRPVVSVGKSPPLFARSFRSLEVRFHPRLPVSYFYPLTPPQVLPRAYRGRCTIDPVGLSVAQLREFYSAGPVASVFAGLCFVPPAWLLPADSPFFWIASFTVISGVGTGLANLVPRKREGRLFSDGYRLAQLKRLDDDTVVPPRRTVIPGQQTPGP